MNIIPALEMKGWRTSALDCTGNQIVVKYEFVSSESFKCRLCNRRELCKSLEKEEKKLVKGKRYLFLCGEENLTEDKREELDKISLLRIIKKHT